MAKQYLVVNTSSPNYDLYRGAYFNKFDCFGVFRKAVESFFPVEKIRFEIISERVGQPPRRDVLIRCTFNYENLSNAPFYIYLCPLEGGGRFETEQRIQLNPAQRWNPSIAELRIASKFLSSTDKTNRECYALGIYKTSPEDDNIVFSGFYPESFRITESDTNKVSTSSVQVRINSIQEAYRKGVSCDEASNGRIINFTPKNLFWYMINRDNLHLGDLKMLSKLVDARTFQSPKIHLNSDKPLQQIFFGAPGTGKSHAINEMCAEYENYRTTFHPDTDYATFVGSYKPITVSQKVYTFMGDKAIPVKDGNGKEIEETKITYRYVFQAFLKAYIAAWKEQTSENPNPVFLIIEEINRGNCAQIFGDIFQLLDRNESGFSDYPIVADDDLAKELRKVFENISVAKHDEINSLYKGGKDVVAKVLDGSQLLLPNNLYIWATMNTSDQSLFPIDSAFKRRWEWKYIKIKRADEGYKIRFSNGMEYDWWQFVKAINEKIEGGEIQQEDKQIGYFFAKAKRHEDGSMYISAERFLSKVIFFLYQDVFKDFGLEEDFFKDDDNQPMTFASYFTEDGSVDESRVERFVRNVIGEENLSLIQEETEDTTQDGEINPKLSVKFNDGEIINTGKQARIYIESLKKIGLEKAAEIFSKKNYKLPLIAKESFETSDSARRYKQVDNWYVLLGPDVYPYYPKLQILNTELNLGLEVTHK